jgi:hypothetical protein
MYIADIYITDINNKPFSLLSLTSILAFIGYTLQADRNQSGLLSNASGRSWYGQCWQYMLPKFNLTGPISHPSPV